MVKLVSEAAQARKLENEYKRDRLQTVGRGKQKDQI